MQHEINFLAPLQLADSGVYTMYDSLYLYVVKLFFKSLLLVFSLILTKLGTRSMHQYGKNREQIFKIFVLKFVANFVNFELGLSLWNSSSRAI